MFITFEGIDFSGKSTQVELLKSYLISNNKKVEIIREPGGTEISEKVRDILLDKENNQMTIETEVFLFSASRAQLVRQKIRPVLNHKIYVISDRFHDSTTAYQGFGRGIPLESVAHVNRLAIGNTIPDITYFIDIPIEVADKRKQNKSDNELDRIELSDYSFYERVRQGYLHLAATEQRFRIIDGTLPVEEIHKLVVKELEIFDNKETL